VHVRLLDVTKELSTGPAGIQLAWQNAIFDFNCMVTHKQITAECFDVLIIY
jgi:hypothetical protein